MLQHSDIAAQALNKASGLKRKVTVLGATGSVGENTLSLIDHVVGAGDAEIEIIALTANTNVESLAAMAIRYKAQFAAIADDRLYARLKECLAGTGIACGGGRQGMLEAASMDADWVMGAIVGAAGLEPMLAAARRGADIALANKECLVSGGDLLPRVIAEGGGQLLPVDSEHNAIFQVYDFTAPEKVARIILTASGGPFRNWTLEQMAEVTPLQACAHPNWEMGAKISVDSATMMNKGLELIEAARLFPTPADKIDILVHPESVIHSMVEYVDGSTLAQLGSPDMRTPIASALAWPQRVASPSQPLDLAAIGKLTFEPPDEARFPALKLARTALEQGTHATCALNAANEVANAAFLKGHLKFLDITRVAQQVLEQVMSTGQGSTQISYRLEDVLAMDHEARQRADTIVQQLAP